MAKLIWEDVPEVPKPPMVYKEEAEELRSNKGSWARFHSANVADDDSVKSLHALGQKIRRGSLNAFKPARSFEVATRTVGDQVRLYVRFTGVQEECEGDGTAVLRHRDGCPNNEERNG